MVDKIDFSEIPKDRGYDSAFESDAEAKERRRTVADLVPGKKTRVKIANKRQLEEEFVKEEGKAHRFHAVAKDAYARHKEYVNNYLLYYGGSKNEFKRDTSGDKRDFDVIKEHHQFLWDESEAAEVSWEKRLAKKYYDKLFKEYCIADLSRYKENKIGMRWRIEQEVIDGKGQFICGNKACKETEDESGLRSWEVNFAYVESGQKKNALVKLRLCPDCSYKLNYRSKHKDVTKKKKKENANLTAPSQPNTKKKRHSDESTAGPSQNDRADKSPKDKGDIEDQEIWSQPLKVTEEKSREDEFECYFTNMFL
ncbi:unnamed protein product [Lymnaea stagnalis]|uniref:Protein FRA10AC1 n=1 Tax=Lymnaea stagnalis TaxID=6523 RepID=A0AAV2H5R1_LYMST